jgi:hypothetical protein
MDMKILPLLILLLIIGILASCTHKIAVPHEGPHLGSVPIQEIEQCKAQPDFPGCANVGR